jgi:hypothetical protein
VAIQRIKENGKVRIFLIFNLIDKQVKNLNSFIERAFREYIREDEASGTLKFYKLAEQGVVMVPC